MAAGSETFPALLARLYAEQFTGAIVVHFGQGVPSMIEIPQPVRIRLDKPPKARHTESLIPSVP